MNSDDKKREAKSRSGVRWVRESVTKDNEIRKNKTAGDEKNETQEMIVRRQIAEKDGLYFVTFTCARWLPLFEIANAYDVVYRWFDFLKSRGHYVVGFLTKRWEEV